MLMYVCLSGCVICLEDGERVGEEVFVVDGSSAAPHSNAAIRSRQDKINQVSQL